MKGEIALSCTKFDGDSIKKPSLKTCKTYAKKFLKKDITKKSYLSVIFRYRVSFPFSYTLRIL